MSMENTVKSFGGAVAFTGVAWLSDVISGALGSLQTSSATFLLDGGITVGVLAITAGIADFLLGTDIIAKTAGIIVIFFSLQAFVSLLTLCVFYAIARISPKGTYTPLDCIIAAGVCLLEAVPFISAFVFWGMFATYLRRQQISAVASMLPQTRALGVAAKGVQALGGGKSGGAGGLLGKVGGLLKK